MQELSYPAKVIKQGNSFYVRVGKEIRQVGDIDTGDIVRVSIEKIADAVERPRREPFVELPGEEVLSGFLDGDAFDKLWGAIS